MTNHPQVGQCKQCLDLQGVLLQATVAHLGEAKLALDYPKRVLNFGPNAGLDLLDFVDQRIQWLVVFV